MSRPGDSSVSPARRAGQDGPRRVLVLDDDAEILLLLSRYLGGLGYDVVTCSDAEEALALTEAVGMDVAILDVGLRPFGREGLDVLRTIRLCDARLPVVIYSGHLTPGIEQEARWLRASAVLRKPQPLSAFAGLLASLLVGRA
jgi:CheY-like chemotaxis protein